MMERRLRALVRKAAPGKELQPAVDPLLAHIVAHVSTKRQYEDLLEDATGVEDYAARHGLPEDQRRLLALLQAKREILTPNPLLDHVLTAAFLAECALVAWSLHGQGLLLVFLGALALTDAVVHRVKALASSGGRALAQVLVRAGAVDIDPLGGPIQMKKWAEQSWQLFVHVGFSAAELFILSEEPWYDRPETCWIPHPHQQAAEGYRTDLKVRRPTRPPPPRGAVDRVDSSGYQAGHSCCERTARRALAYA
jgi:hypothetical protein